MSWLTARCRRISTTFLIPSITITSVRARIQHTHAANQNPHSHSANQDAHSHGGVLVSGGTFAFGSPAFTAQPGRTDTQQPAVHIDTQQPVVNIGANSTGITNTDYGATGISVTDVQGGGAAHNNLPPYVALNFIVRYI